MSQNSNPAVVLEKVGDIAIEQRPIPTIKDPHYVKLAIKATGICGSDIHYYRSGGIGKYILKAPMVLGHESSGQVVEVGDAVTRVKVGDRVAIEPGVPSRYSDETKEGRYNLCPHMAFAATPPIDGTLVKYYLSPEDFLVKLPEGVSYEEGACVEPLSVGVHSNKLAGVRFGTKVVVFGAGPVGLLTGAVARAFGATDVIFVDVFDNKLQRAKDFGATNTFNSSQFSTDKAQDLADGVQKLLGGNHADVVFECSGADVCIDAAVKTTKIGGTMVQVGMGKNYTNFPIAEVSGKEMKLIGCFRYSFGDYRDAVNLVATGKVNVKPLITHKFKFEDAAKAYDYNIAHGGEVVKTIIFGPE
ncbi:AQG_2a_G0006760.mRNA.1.CDS.1 [Saccharomyces cerevisiae]|nr:AQG_2a_G0006760.mRNA.1.CDS.1 [Saccharomyces cerevisiae]CAI7059662.1 AQG_2a_G0006760.mRNA.1.CDS.1 [Saccharomyces cerevisiae]